MKNNLVLSRLIKRGFRLSWKESSDLICNICMMCVGQLLELLNEFLWKNLS